MKLSDKAMTFLIKELKVHEGKNLDSATKRHKAYRCPAGFLTVGYGHNLDANPLSVPMRLGDTISEQEAEKLLQDDIQDAIRQLDRAFVWASILDEPRYTALVNMVFNMGIGTLKTFKNSLALLEQGKYKESAENFAQSKWYKQVGNRAIVICERIKTGAF